MDKSALHDIIAEKYSNICGIVATKNGNTVYSDYWHGFSSKDTVHVMSVTKSVVSIMVGIGIDLGLIRDVEQYVLDFFPDYKIKRGEKTIRDVKIKHLLTMTAPYKYKYEPWTKVCTSEDWTIAALDILGGRNGITEDFKYSTLGIHILTGILSKTSGMNTVDFANKYLFEPLEIGSYSPFFARTAEEHKEFIMSKEPKGNIWFSDPKDVGCAGYGLCLSAEDMAKIGRLCLNLGEYNGKRVVSKEWISESTRPRIKSPLSFNSMEYGYLWWTPVLGRNVYAALGNSGNIIYIDKEANTVVAINATFKPGVIDRVDFIKSYIEPQFSNA